MYHKYIPSDLQMKFILNLCLKGWKYFEIVTYQFIKLIYLHKHDDNLKENSKHDNDNKIN
jgi:hypothetical protein